MAEFPIGCWTYFGVNRAWDTLAKDYHELGLNNPMTPRFEAGDDPAVMIRLLDDFGRYGMKVFVFDERVTVRANGPAFDEGAYRARFAVSLEQFGAHPAVKGFYVMDEPDACDAEAAFAAARVQREMAPNLVPYLNLLPWFDWIGERIGSPAYAPYLERAAKEGNLAQIGYDCYTQMWAGDSGYDVYFDNLRCHRDVSVKMNIPYCTTLLSSGHYDYACPDQDAFRWQISTAAALGAKVITYFYVAGTNPHHNYRQFPINAFNERTATFGALSEENRIFQQWYGDLMLELTNLKAEFTEKAYGGLQKFAPDDTLLAADNAKGINMLVSTFKDAAGVQYRVVVNLDRKANIEARLRFRAGVKVEKRTFDRTFEPAVAYADAVGARSADGVSIPMWLAAGQMALLRETEE